MNISGVEIYPSSLMDEYDIALRNLHQEIMLQSVTKDYDKEAISEYQGVVLTTRNKIAKALHAHSWCSVPEEDRH